MIGERIKSQRIKNGLTQKDLADKLFVTSQAVSRWENGEVEPSISTLQEMAKIFNVSIDSLVSDKEVEKEVVEVVKEVEKVVMPKVHLCLCEKCNSPIYEQSNIHRFTTRKRVGSGRHHHYDNVSHVYCTNCYNKLLAEQEREKKRLEEERQYKIKRRRIHSFVWPTILALILIIIGIVQFTKGNNKPGTFLVIVGPLSFTMLSCFILGDNCVADIWMGVASWTVKFPGLIFSLDLDGIVWFITVKLIFGIISFMLSLACILFATGIALFISAFVYPGALIKNLNGKTEL